MSDTKGLQTHVQSRKSNDQNSQHMRWAMGRKGNFRQKYCLLLRRFYAFIWKTEVSWEVILYCNYVLFGCSCWAITILPCVWHLLFIKFPTSEVP